MARRARVKPKNVMAAILRNDTTVLKALGKKGGIARRTNTARRTNRRNAIMEMEMQAMRYQALEHLSDPNRESVEYSRVITSA